MTKVGIDYVPHDNIWVFKADGQVMCCCSDDYVCNKAKFYSTNNLEDAFKIIVFDAIVNGLSECADNALVKWFLTKTIKYGI